MIVPRSRLLPKVLVEDGGGAAGNNSNNADIILPLGSPVAIDTSSGEDDDVEGEETARHLGPKGVLIS